MLDKIVSFKPLTAREKQIVHSLGADGWTIISYSASVVCLGFGEGCLLKKNGYIRWVNRGQVIFPKEETK